MCLSDQFLRLCSCQDMPVVHNKKSRRNKHKPAAQEGFSWRLYRYLGSYDSGMIGRCIMPVWQLNEQLTKDFVLQQLNTHACFDFDYQPNEGDYLSLQPRKGFEPFMGFIYRSGKWIANTYDAFSDEIQEVRNGCVEVK